MYSFTKFVLLTKSFLVSPFQHFAHESKPGTVGSFELSRGVNKFCLAEPGVYQLTPESCHQFEQDFYRYDT